MDKLQKHGEIYIYSVLQSHELRSKKVVQAQKYLKKANMMVMNFYINIYARTCDMNIFILKSISIHIILLTIDIFTLLFFHILEML